MVKNPIWVSNFLTAHQHRECHYSAINGMKIKKKISDNDNNNNIKSRPFS